MVSSWWAVAAIAALFAVPVLAGGAGEGGAPPEPAGYRMEDYRAPTPALLTGAVTVSDDEAMSFWKSNAAIFIDVMPRPVRPPNLPEGTIWRQPERRNIPGSAWLPNTGYGVLNAPVTEYFAGNLRRLTGGDKDKPLLIYCLENCWMSWNAARRALGLGYRKIYWYPAGTDGWARIGGALEVAEPVP
jgi:PQQ-dependent catabolism-associated CXXCW motif protein